MNRTVLTAFSVLSLAATMAACVSTESLAQQGKPPFAGGAGADKDAAVDKLHAAALNLEKQSKAKPKDTKLKLKAAEAYYQSGHAAEYSPNLSPRVKYRAALRDYRAALALDPAHKKAAQEKKTIEDIYKSMGREVPK
jgi:hypothetical protein